MEILGYVYKVSNTVNNMYYIGQTTLPIELRWKLHIWDSKRIDDRFHSALRKHGIDKFLCEVIERCPIKELNNREKYWISVYDSYVEGYNNTRGGTCLLKNGISFLLDKAEDIIYLYEVKHYSCYQIAKNFNVDKKVVNNLLRICGKEIRHKELNLNAEELLEIITRFNNGESCNKISKDYLTNGSTIKNILLKNNIKVPNKYLMLEDTKTCSKIKEDFVLSDLSYKDILNKYHINYLTLKKIVGLLKRIHHSRAKQFNKQESDMILSLYAENKSLTFIGKQFNTSAKTIKNFLKCYNNIKTV